MFSQRLFSVLELVLKVANTFQVCAVKFDKQKCLIYTDREWKTTRNVYVNLVFSLSWFIGEFIQIFYFYKKGDLDRMNLALAFVMGALVFLTIYTITAIYPTSSCRIINGLFQLFRYLQSKPQNSQMLLLPFC